MSGCLAKEGDAACQSLLWPEQEGPKVLFKRCWEPPFQGTMTPRQSFQAILRVSAVHQPRKGYHGLLDFAWRYFERPSPNGEDAGTAGEAGYAVSQAAVAKEL